MWRHSIRRPMVNLDSKFRFNTILNPSLWLCHPDRMADASVAERGQFELFVAKEACKFNAAHFIAHASVRFRP
jgi:hypothetical protein